MVDDELKPCPFCGGAVEISVFVSEEDGSELYGVTCDSCGLYADFSEGIKELETARIRTVMAWNRRFGK